MDYKEKYNAALDRAKEALLTSTTYQMFVIEEIFPELKENEDGQMLREIKRYIKEQGDKPTGLPNGTVPVSDMIAWLEKQGELDNNDTDILNRFSFYSYKDEPNILYLSELYVNKEQRNKGIGTKILKIADEVAANMKCNSIRLKTEIGSNAERLYRKNGYNSLKIEGNQIWLEKKGEQTTDKIESKFNVKDWVIFNGTVAKILDKQKYGFVGLDIDGKDFFCNYGHADSMCLWSINDAKDGDVLVTEDYIFIFKYILHGGVHLYCHYNFDDEEFDSDIPDAVIGNICDKGIHFRPATKEQRDMLFQKMKEAGYAWDAEKKELKKIELKKNEPKFHHGDWITDGYICYKIIEILDDRYIIESKYDKRGAILFEYENRYHLWSINDAKDGDVLAINWNEYNDSFEKIIIFKKYHNKGVEGLFNTPCVEDVIRPQIW